MNKLNTSIDQSSNFTAYKAIQDLIYQYAFNIRKGQNRECVTLFVENGVFEVRDAPMSAQAAPTTRARLEGQDAILSYLEHTTATGARVCPTVQNIIVKIDGNSAQASSVMTSIVWPHGNRIVGEYDDRFCYDGGWRFSSRTFSILGQFGPG